MKTLDKKGIEDIVALTPLQEGMLFHYLKAPKSDLYFEQLSLGISGRIDIEVFEKAWNFVIETNEMLRTVFRWKEVEKPIQIILKEHQLSWKYYNVSNKDAPEGKKILEEIKTNDRNQGFDLQDVPFRISLIKVKEDEYEMMISNHHILYDGWSNGIILKEFFNAYGDLPAKQTPVKPVKTPFKEFIQWIHRQDKDEQERFWEEYLAGFDTQTKLPIKKRKPGETTTPGPGNDSMILAKDIKVQLEDLIKNRRVTLASFFYSVWGILLQRYCNSEDIIFGTTVSGRPAKIREIEEMVGLFINTIPLRVRTEPGEKISDLLYRINNILPIRERYEWLSLVDIKKYSELENTGELFDTIIVPENYPLDCGRTAGNSQSPLVVEAYSMKETTTYDLTIGILMGDDIEINFSYPGGLFENTDIRRLFHHFTNIMEHILKDPDREISGLEMLSGKEKRQILYDFNNTVEEYPRGKRIQELFAEQVVKTPDHTALISGDNRLSYGYLNERANQLAHLLRKKGVKTDTIVGIMVERSLEMIIGIFAILKSDGAYLPIDPEYPEEHIRCMLTDSEANVLVTTPNISAGIKIVNCQLSIVNCQREIACPEPGTPE
ncbi:MAG: AMP-binding protein, partial [Candidatus Aminicenantes bacterium]